MVAPNIHGLVQIIDRYQLRRSQTLESSTDVGTSSRFNLQP